MNSPTITRRKRSRAKPQSRFQSLWIEAEKLAHENDTLHEKLDSLVQRINTEVGDAERSLGETISLAVHRQLDFSEKKSLLKWQRAELTRWTEELLAQLVQMGQLDDTLRNRLALLQANAMGIEIDQSSETGPAEQLRAYMDQQYADQGFDEMDSPDDQDFQDDEDDLAELLEQLREQFGDDTDAPPIEEAGVAQKKTTFDDSVFKRLFRQTAAALHPDKESDPERQRDKHELMSELLRARKERDLITIVRLHETHAFAESVLSAADEKQLEDVLLDYLDQQQARTESIVQRSPMHQWVYEEFYHHNKATVTRRIKAHIRKIDTRRAGFDVFVERVKTLKVLKDILEDRYEQHRYEDDWF